MTVEFEIDTDIAAPAEAVFDLSLSIDAHLGSMASSGERAIAGVTSGLIGLGETVTWQARHFGLPWRMTTKITEWDRPQWFVDEQVRGPFASYRHEHRFETTATEGTRMHDRVVFRAPAGPLGTAVERLVLGTYLRNLITQRNAHLRAMLEQ